jgi:hypothetical protein
VCRPIHGELTEDPTSREEAHVSVVHDLGEWLAKAAAGGVMVVVFAVLAEMVTPKRLAGVLSAAPSVALGSLAVTLFVKGQADAAAAARGMVLGAIAFTTCCLVAVPALGRWGLWRGSAVALACWGVTGAVLYQVVWG